MRERIESTGRSTVWTLKLQARVFDDPAPILIDDRIIGREQRWHAIGAVSAALLLVVHIYSEGDNNGEEIIRIIPAREANQRKRRIYFQQAAR